MACLIVDRAEDFRTLLQERFEESGRLVHALPNLLEAGVLLGRVSFEVAVLDLDSCRRSLPLFLKSLRRSQPECRVVLMLGDGEVSEADLDRFGAEAELAKPFRFRDLEAHLAPPAAREPAETSSQDRLRLTVYSQVDPRELVALKSYAMRNPEDEHARWLLAVTYYRAGKYKDAAYLLGLVAEEAPHNPLVHYYLANSLYHQGEYQQAIRGWDRVLELEPQSPLGAKARRLRGHVCEVLEDAASKA